MVTMMPSMACVEEGCYTDVIARQKMVVCASSVLSKARFVGIPFIPDPCLQSQSNGLGGIEDLWV